MQQLKTQFVGRGEVKGFTFRCIEQVPGVAYIYAVHTNDPSHPEYFEVFKHSENSFLKRVAYPGSNSFGSWAWTFRDEVRARRKYANLLNGKTDTSDQ